MLMFKTHKLTPIKDYGQVILIGKLLYGPKLQML